ncbi:MAG TPA: TIGR03790 family protein [Bryobacteraceae bacterium]|nr:TIGR03790 family protein [Bryobacteraceae bacterium]
MLKLALFLGLAAAAFCQSAENVLVVVNESSPLSQSIAQYYVQRRHIPPANVCFLNVKPDEEISRNEYQAQIAAPIAAFLRAKHLENKILYVVTTAGLPLRVTGHASGLMSETASVDSELALLYSDMRGHPHAAPAGIANPFFGKINAPFRHPDFPIYLVTRLAGYDLADVKGIIDRALVARNRGRFVIDLKAADNTEGNGWLREAARQLPADRVVLDGSAEVLYDLRDVIAYASWGSNDPNRKKRHLGFQWLPGAIATEYVSTDGRTFARPPDGWTMGAWGNPLATFAGSPQGLTADYIHDGATGASGHVAEPFLQFTPRPNILLPVYYRGRNLAESFYLSIPELSWMNIVIGDPLCALGKP